MMAMTETDIKVIIAAELKKQGFTKAQRATSDLEKSFKRLGKTIVGVFAARKIIAFTRDSARAFAEEDKAIRSLSYSLESLGLAFQGSNIEQFISNTQRAAAVSDGVLRPAYQTLVNATLDVSKAQDLLNLALDISAATGKDVTAVTTALSRAYLKDVSALGKLNVGLTGAQLKTMSFAEAQDLLTSKFGGQAAVVADTYAGKINSMSIAFDEAQEVIGKKFVKALEILANGKFENVLDFIASTAERIGNGFIVAAYGLAQFKAALKGDFKQIVKLQEQANLALLGGYSPTAKPVAGILQKQMKAQKDLLKAQEDARKKAEKAAKKAEAERLARKRAQTIFDMDNIQVVAALQGKIDGEERMRLTALLALQTDNVTAAEKLADIVVRLNAPALANLGVMIKAGDTIDDVIKKLITSQAKLAGLQLMAEDFPELDNPFEEWESTLESILALLLQILNLSNKKAGQTGIYALDKLGFSSLESYQNYRSGERASIVNSSFSNLAGATGTVLPSMTTNNSGVVVNVAVAGNVTTQNDLVNSITNALYQKQKDGQSILYSSTAI